MRGPLRHGRTFGGWRIRYAPAEPITGRWIAEKQGVEVCAGTPMVLEEILRLRKKTQDFGQDAVE